MADPLERKTFSGSFCNQEMKTMHTSVIRHIIHDRVQIDENSSLAVTAVEANDGRSRDGFEFSLVTNMSCANGRRISDVSFVLSHSTAASLADAILTKIPELYDSELSKSTEVSSSDEDAAVDQLPTKQPAKVSAAVDTLTNCIHELIVGSENTVEDDANDIAQAFKRTITSGPNLLGVNDEKVVELCQRFIYELKSR